MDDKKTQAFKTISEYKKKLNAIDKDIDLKKQTIKQLYETVDDLKHKINTYKNPSKKWSFAFFAGLIVSIGLTISNPAIFFLPVIVFVGLGFYFSAMKALSLNADLKINKHLLNKTNDTILESNNELERLQDKRKFLVSNIDCLHDIIYTKDEITKEKGNKISLSQRNLNFLNDLEKDLER